MARVTPAPLAMIQSTHDEFVSLDTARELYRMAAEPKRIEIIEATNHRFAGNRQEFLRRLDEVIDWAARESAR